MHLGWIGKSIIAIFCFMPASIAIVFFKRNYGIKPEAMLVWYFLGITIGSGLILPRPNILENKDFFLNIPLFIMIILGIVFGTSSNTLLFQAISMASNAGLPLAIVNIHALVTFLTMIFLAWWLPGYFEKAQFHPAHLIGIILILVGVLLIALKRA